MPVFRATVAAPWLLLTLLLVALCGGGDAWAQQTPPAPASPPPTPAPAPPAVNILVVDFQALLQNSKAAKMVHQQIEQKRNEFAKEVSQQEQQLRQELETARRQAASLSPEAAKQKEREFQTKASEFDRSVQAKREILEKANNEAFEKINQVALKIITEIAKERNANLVLLRNMLVVYAPAFDITAEVLQKLDEQMPTLTVDFTAPVASAAPAAPAATPAAAPAPRRRH
jgi:Skp family chaperone for outer membrane proteins